MSYPYLGDLVNQIFGVSWNIPIPMFGLFVAIALVVFIYVAEKELARIEKLGLVSGAKFYSKNDTQYVIVPTHEIVASLVLLSTISGIIGARIFHILEYTGEFLNDPASMIFTRSGFSVYGGVTFGIITGIIYLKKRGVPVIPILDALAPSMILGYGIGRIGCQVSGDGDWGVAADMALKPGWLPDWLWAQTYENNIAGVVIQHPGVYPTPIYETGAALVIFAFLWAVRKAPNNPGYLFSLYLLFSGFERLLIEKIRTNSEYHLGGFIFTQAELISTIIIFAGLIGVIKTSNSKYLLRISYFLVVIGALSACTIL